MAFDLPLGFGHETKAGAIAEQSRERADAERSCIPERIQHAGSGAELFQPGLAPGQVVGLLASRMEHEFAHFGVPGEQGLRVIERLGGHLAGMIHPHQGRGFAPVVGGKGWHRRKASAFSRGFLDRQGPARSRGREQGAQSAIRRRDKGVQVGPTRHGAGL